MLRACCECRGARTQKGQESDPARAWPTAAAVDESERHAAMFAPGARVCVHDLHDRPALNGCVGAVIRFHVEKDRFALEIEQRVQDAAGERVLIREENLSTATQSSGKACLPEFLCRMMSGHADDDGIAQNALRTLTAWLDSGGNANARRAPRFEVGSAVAVRPTLLMVACSEAALLVVQTLLRLGADPAIQDGDRDALHCVIESTHKFATEAPERCQKSDLNQAWTRGIDVRRRCANALLAAGIPTNDGHAQALWSTNVINVMCTQELEQELRWRHEYRDAGALDPETFGQRAVWNRRLLGITRTDILVLLRQGHPTAHMSDRAVELTHAILHEALACLVMVAMVAPETFSGDDITAQQLMEVLHTGHTEIHETEAGPMSIATAMEKDLPRLQLHRVEAAMKRLLKGQLGAHAARSVDRVMRGDDGDEGALRLEPAGIGCSLTSGRGAGRQAHPRVALYLAAVVEYLLADILEVTFKRAKGHAGWHGDGTWMANEPVSIGLFDVIEALWADDELGSCVLSDDLTTHFVNAHLLAGATPGGPSSERSVDLSGPQSCELAVEAAGNGRESAVGAWLLDGGSVDACQDGEHGRTLLTSAAYEGHERVVKLLLRHQADVDLPEQVCVHAHARACTPCMCMLPTWTFPSRTATPP